MTSEAEGVTLKSWPDTKITTDSVDSGVCSVDLSMENQTAQGYDLKEVFNNPTPPQTLGPDVQQTYSYTQVFHYVVPCNQGVDFVQAARDRARELGFADKVTFVETNASGYTTDGPVDLASCCGATWIADGSVGTLDLLERSLKPTGIALIGESYWRETPSGREAVEPDEWGDLASWRRAAAASRARYRLVGRCGGARRPRSADARSSSCPATR